jgi:hypothetical protein
VAYFYQTGRFMLLPAAMLGIGAATLIADGVRAVALRFRSDRVQAEAKGHVSQLT